MGSLLSQCRGPQVLLKVLSTHCMMPVTHISECPVVGLDDNSHLVILLSRKAQSILRGSWYCWPSLGLISYLKKKKKVTAYSRANIIEKPAKAASGFVSQAGALLPSAPAPAQAAQGFTAAAGHCDSGN